VSDSRGVARLTCTVCVLAKEPVPGRVKTRLCPPLDPRAAAGLHAAFVEDTLARLAGLAHVRVVLVAHPAGRAPELGRIAGRWGARLAWQHGDHLGQRMLGAASSWIEEGPVVLLGADVPDLPLAYVARAVSLLERPGFVVVGPSSDGGYYLLGMRGVVPPVFGADVDWGSPSVFAATMARLARGSVPTAVLPAWQDVDDADDLRALARRVSRWNEMPRTATILGRLVEAGVLR